MHKHIIGLLLFFVMVATAVNAQMSIGVSPIFGEQKISNKYLDATFTNRGTAWEGNLGYYTRGVTLRGYHLFKTSYTNSGTIKLEENKTTINKPIEITNCFCASRIEIGLPTIRPGFIFEPFFVSSYTKNCYSISGDKLDYTDSIINNTSGLGVLYIQRMSRGQNFNIKYSKTPKDQMLDLSYQLVMDNQSWGMGYKHYTFDNVVVSGPSITFSLAF